MPLQKNDFIEIEFTARTADGEIFDSNIKDDLKKANLNIEAKPAIFSLGEGMFLKGVDDFLLGKELGKHTIELSPENAFGNRDSKLIQLIPMKIFREQKLNPIPGVMFNFDGRIAKVLSVSGGRVIADFNNPIAGKSVVYAVNVLRKLDDENEKVRSLMDFLFRRTFDFEIKDKKIIVKAENAFVKFLELFKDKFKEILDLEMSVVEEEKKETENSKETSDKENISG